MSYDYLVDHALKNAWCTPDQDMQAIVKPARLTPPIGVFNKVEVLWRNLTLPQPATRFHVYQIGQLHPLLMGLFPIKQTWENVAVCCGLESLIVDIYNVKGINMPRSEVWYMVTEDRNLIFAIKDQPKIPVDLRGGEEIFVRVYSNAYFNTLRADTANDVIKVKGGQVRDNAEIFALQLAYNACVAKPGLTSAYVNGMLVSGIDLVNCHPGDVAEFVYDSSVKHVVEWNVADLLTFQSTLDSKFKYLLHYPGVGDNTIDYMDDTEVFVLHPTAGSRFQGLLYHRNSPDAVRQVTHKDYAIVPAYVQAQADTQGWNLTQLKIRMVIRKAGWLRPLINEDSRIKELYKLPDADVARAMLGIDSTVSNWRAENLEAAGYTQIMRSKVDQVTGAMVEQAYGYNAISSLIAMTPSFTRLSSGQRVVDVPYGLQTRSTAYEYDTAGKLLGWFTHVEGSTYGARNFSCRMVEMYAGDVADRLDEYYGDATVYLDTRANYRMYRCPMVGGLPNNHWEDVTDSGQYTLLNGVLNWLLDPTEWYTLVRSDRTALGLTLNLDASDGLIEFSLTHRQLRFNSVGNYVMQIPMGELEVWLNGHCLIEGLDYVMHFPKVVITNKKYMVAPQTQNQRIDVRFSGFCSSELEWEKPQDVGFVVYGQLSHNTRFDIRDDKVMRIVVDGVLKDRSELKFTEDDPAIQITAAANGSPYMIRDIVVPMRGFTDQGTYPMRAHSQEIDQRISDYLTLKHPQTPHTQPSAIGQPYAVYSPFVNKILRDLISGVIDNAPIKLHYNDVKVREICAPYEYLLAFDPTQDDNLPDQRFVNIDPHCEPNVLDVDIYHYKFIARVVALYTQNRVSLSHFLRIAEIA